MPLIEQLSLQNHHLVALCGAGGKTSLLYALGREWTAQKEKVALTTSTHIQAQMPPGCVLWDGPDEEALLSIWRAGLIPVAGRPEGRKLKEPSEAMWAILRQHADRIVVEADGAARRPMKYPAVWEPVIPQYTDRVLGDLHLLLGVVVGGDGHGVVFCVVVSGSGLLPAGENGDEHQGSQEQGKRFLHVSFPLFLLYYNKKARAKTERAQPNQTVWLKQLQFRQSTSHTKGMYLTYPLKGWLPSTVSQ